MIKDSICNGPSGIQGGYVRGFNNPNQTAQAEKPISPNPSVFNAISELKSQVEVLKEAVISYMRATSAVSIQLKPEGEVKIPDSPMTGVTAYDEIEQIRASVARIRYEVEKAESRLCL